MRDLRYIDGSGNRRNLSELAEEYWQKINPTKSNGEYYVRQSLIGRIKDNIGKFGDSLNNLLGFVLDEANSYNRLKRIVTSSPNILEGELIPELIDYQSSIGYDPNIVNDSKIIIGILGYKSIRKNHTNWLINKLRIKACPYCASQYILGYEIGKSRKVLCELDHFYSKTLYPCFAVSFFNLIPSCGPCNRLKSESQTWLRNYPHPYVDNIDSFFKWRSDHEGIVKMILKLIQKREKALNLIYWEPSENLVENDKQKIIRHFERFKINEIYQNHGDIVEEIYWKYFLYNDSRKQELLSWPSELDLSEEEIDRFILGNYVNEDDLLKRPLAKLYKDIGKELDLISS